MFELDFRNIIVLVSLAIHAALLVVLFRYGRKTAGGKAYTIAILAIAGWIMPMALYRSNLFGEALLWARLLYAMASLTSTSFLFFTLIFPDNKRVPIWLQIFFIFENFLIILLCFHPTLMISGLQFVPGHETRILWGSLYFIYANHISLLFLAGFIVLYLKRRKADALVKSQINYILGGYFVAANLAMTTNLILPWLGYFELNWLGQFFSTLIAVLTTYANLKRQLLYIRLIATEGFILILNFLLVVQLIFSKSYQNFLVNLLVLAAVAAISVLLVKSVNKEIQRREELTKANLRLQELDKQKTEFLDIASHQLRTPLSALIGLLSMQCDGDFEGLEKTEIKQQQKNMLTSAERLKNIVHDLMEAMEVELGAKLKPVPTDIAKLIEDTINTLQPNYERKKLFLKYTPPDSPLPQINADPSFLTHVFMNLIDNACNYTEAGGATIELYQEKNQVVFQIIDTGIGITAKEKENLFGKFVRAKRAMLVRPDGSGLGLFIVKKIVEAHGGKIILTSDGENKGSAFKVYLPAKL